MSKLALALTGSILSLLLASCAPATNPTGTTAVTGDPPGPPPATLPAVTWKPPSPGRPPVLPFEITASTSKAAYLPGEPIKIDFTFRNKTAEPVSMTAFPPQVEITRGSPYQAYRSFSAGTGSKLLKPQELGAFSVIWDQKDATGRQVDPGWYLVEVKFEGIVSADADLGRHTFTVTPARVLVQYPQGVMEKTIDVNQSQTAEGITVTLERLELSVDGIKLYTFSKPPGYVWATGPTPPPPKYMTNQAEYSTDDGAFAPAGMHSGRFPENGMYQTFRVFDPLPANAKTLTFRITRFVDQPGLWEFKVQLD